MIIVDHNGLRKASAEEEKASMAATVLRETTRPLTVEEVTDLLIRSRINDLDVDDRTASRMTDFHPTLTGSGALVTAGTRINWQGRLKRAAVDLWDTAENTPDAAPTLWEELSYRDGVRIIPETITAGLAFALDELGWWGEELYRSVVEDNVWTPEAGPECWEVV